LGGWTEGFLNEGYEVIGFDNQRHSYGEDRYPAQLVIQDVRTLHGSHFRDAAIIVASPPCQRYSYMAMPWKRAKAMAERYRQDIGDLNELFDTCFRLQREASKAAGHHIPLVVENVKGAQPWVGRAAWHFGSYYLWGDVPALMPMAIGVRKLPPEISASIKAGKSPMRWTNPDEHYFEAGRKNTGGSWFAAAHNAKTNNNPARNGYKSTGQDWSRHAKTGETSPHWRMAAAGVKCGGSWFHDYRSGQGPRNHASDSIARQAASARIAKIPFPLASWIAKCYRPQEVNHATQ
jgi:hypothetical protein